MGCSSAQAPKCTYHNTLEDSGVSWGTRENHRVVEEVP